MAELVRLQGRTGELIAQLRGPSVDILLFGEEELVSVPLPEHLKANGGAISPNGEEIAFQQPVASRQESDQRTQDSSYRWILSVVRTDGKNLRQFPQVEEPTAFCWSLDAERLAYVSAIKTDKGVIAAHQLQVLNLKSGQITAITTAANISSQCWNQDGTAVVFDEGGTLRAFEVAGAKTTTLTTGDYGTWSPDGRQIAFRRGDSYYTIKPSGSDEKLLLKEKRSLTPLWWSSNSSYVSYVAKPPFWAGWSNIPDEVDLRVVRLADHKETVAYRFSEKGRPLTFQWIRSPALLTTARTASRP